MADDNKLNLVVQFLGIDKLTPAMKNIVGLGRSGTKVLGDLTAQQRKLNKEIAEYDRRINSASGSVTSLWNSQKKLLAQQEAVTGKINRQKAFMAIDGRTARMSQRGGEMMAEGGASFGWAALLAAPVYAMAHAAGEQQSLENRLRVLGLDNQTVSALEANARRAQVAGASYLDMMRYTVEAQGAFRESGQGTLAERINGARIMSPILARMSFASKALGTEMPEDQERYLLRFIEEAGGMNNPARAAAIADGVFRALQSSGGNVQASDYQQFMAAAGTSGMKLSQRSLFADFEPLIGELHEGAGVGLMSAYLRVNGVGKLLKQPAAEMQRLGLWSGGKPGLTQQNSALFASDPVEFYRNVVMPAYAKAGVKDTQRENALLFGRAGSMLFNQIDRQLPAILRSRSAYQKTQGLDAAYNGAVNGFFGQQGQMTAAWKDFLVVAGSKGGLLENLTAALRVATGTLRTLTVAANAHPTAFRWIVTAVTALVGMKLAVGAAKFAFGGLLGPVGKLWGLFSKIRVAGGILEAFPALTPVVRVLAGMFPRLATAVSAGRTAFLILGQALRWTFLLGRALLPLFGTISLATMGWIVLIGAAAVAIYVYRDKIIGALRAVVGWAQSKFASLPGWMKNIGMMMMDGLLLGLNPMLFADRLVDIAHRGVTAIRKALNLHSPSRVMMEIGGHVAEGLALGVDRRAHRPIASMRRLGTGLVAAAAVASPAAAHARTPVQVIINVYQQPGEDGHAFANRVGDIIDRRLRHHRLSSYGDDF